MYAFRNVILEKHFRIDFLNGILERYNRGVRVYESDYFMRSHARRHLIIKCPNCLHQIEPFALIRAL